MNVIPSRRRLFWSGGFDSTARLLDLVRVGERVEVQYVPTGQAEADWQKNRREHEARRRILAALPADWRTRIAVADPLPYDWQIYAEMVKDFAELHQRGGGGWFSGQGPMLAAFARLIGTTEATYVGSEIDPHVVDLFRRSGVMLPWLGVGKPAILAHARRHRVVDLLALTWSCEGDDEAAAGPCGQCKPCRERIIPARMLGEAAAAKQQSGVMLALPHVQ